MNGLRIDKTTMIIGFLTLFGLVFFLTGLSKIETGGNVARIVVSGPIVGEDTKSVFIDGVASSNVLVKQIEKAKNDENIVAIIVEMNSPGGSAVASDEIAQALEKSNKTTVTVIREVGASGGYWIASSTDHIIAHPLSITGSIGVIGSYLDFSGFIQDHNVTYQRYIAGKFKDLGTPFREPTADEREFFQEKLNTMHKYFINHVAQGRNMSVDQVEPLAQGQIFLGAEAYDVGLVDELGGMDEAIHYIESLHNVSVEIVDYKKEPSLAEILGGVTSQFGFFVGSGIGERIVREGTLTITA
ncbi:signal peptide peptidase SppA [Candidatus Woesearchaeota archaeon]|nr:MAG: signal peptide peptidase SppA [Candidatus Woesearchaeota archaeon]